MKKYNFKEIESKWLKIWEKRPCTRTSTVQGKKFYALTEFPYPSGKGLHMGHAFTYPILDILARKKRMEGYDVLHPIGWDAFGLPTENYALKTGTHPTTVTKRNTDRFREQMKRLALSYDWDREVNTTDPVYYRWTQWIFIQLFKHGLAYKKKMPINWCPSCKIGLANEEVINGKCERCGAGVSRRELDQWLLRITDYADRLADELDLVDYPDYVKAAQRNWIGRSEGVEIKFSIFNSQFSIPVFTTRPDTIHGATFMVLAPEHPIIKKIRNPKFEIRNKLSAYVKQAKDKSDLDRQTETKEKTGVFTGLYCINPVNKEKIPVWVADYVVMEYGTGAVMGVPFYDERDMAFVKKYKLAVKKVPLENMKEITRKIIKNGWGSHKVNYHLRDWIFSRQHYWGEPIPMVNCPKCGWVPVPEKDLPVKLPKVEKYQPTGTGESPLAAIREWVEVSCPECGQPARRETDTMPNWAGSSWYYLAYAFWDKLGAKSEDKKNVFIKYKKLLDYWLPVDIYLGGAEHTTLHLLYSRFWHKFLNDIGMVPGKEPYQARRQHGVILGEDGYRMSKSRGNIINPEEVMEKYGADVLRLYLLFMGPYDQTMPWNTKGVEGCARFLKRVWNIYQKIYASSQERLRLTPQLHRLVKKVSEDIDSLKHNTAIAAMMEFINSWSRQENSLSLKEAAIFLKLLSPFAPYITEEIWSGFLNKKTSIHQQKWPQYEPELTKENMVTIIVQINGKLREKLEVQSAKSKEKSEIEKLAKRTKKVQKYLKNKKVKKVIFLPSRLINFVI